MTDKILPCLNLRELEKTHSIDGMKRAFQEIADFLNECNEDGYMLPKWEPKINMD